MEKADRISLGEVDKGVDAFFSLPFNGDGIVEPGRLGDAEVSCAAEKIVDAEDRNETQRLIAAENKDRKALYGEIARLNKDQNVSVSEVEQIYAFERLKRAKTSEIFQLPSTGADFDAFKASPAGKSLGEECKPDAWVTIK